MNFLSYSVEWGLKDKNQCSSTHLILSNNETTHKILFWFKLFLFIKIGFKVLQLLFFTGYYKQYYSHFSIDFWFLNVTYCKKKNIIYSDFNLCWYFWGSCSINSIQMSRFFASMSTLHLIWLIFFIKNKNCLLSL